MTSAEGTTELRFEPPGPGSWELDPVHFPRPATRYWVETHPDAFKRGVEDFNGLGPGTKAGVGVFKNLQARHDVPLDCC
jgi:hypothetical protein